MNWRNRFARFMYGRNGADELYRFMFYIYLLIFIINLFLKSILLELVELTFVIIMFYRVFSKNIFQRRKENQSFLRFKYKVKKILSFKKKQNQNDSIYKRCSNCNKKLKLPLPSKIGIKYVVCPKCGKRLRFLILRKQKVEIIKK